MRVLPADVDQALIKFDIAPSQAKDLRFALPVDRTDPDHDANAAFKACKKSAELLGRQPLLWSFAGTHGGLF